MFKALTLIALLAMPTTVVAQSMPAATFVAKAGAGDLYERQSSQLVLRTGDPAIRRFAMMMVRDHTKSTNDIKAAARTARVRVATPVLSPEQGKMIAELRAARAPERERLYVQQQRLAHQQALDLHSAYARNGQARSLRTVAARIAPVVQHHIEMLRSM